MRKTIVHDDFTEDFNTEFQKHTRGHTTVVAQNELPDRA